MSTLTHTNRQNIVTPIHHPTAAIIGMGHVGVVTAAALVSRGWRIIGVEQSEAKLAVFETGRSPVREPGVEEALTPAWKAGKFEVTSNFAHAVRQSRIIMIAVGTPPTARGTADLSAIDAVTAQLAHVLAGDRTPRVVMIRSTVPPGSTATRIAPALKAAAPALAVCHHPEFLREGSSLADWANPPMIVTGCDPADRPAVDEAVELLYGDLVAPRQALLSAESEVLKYACNIFHAVKIDFANEIGSLAQACGADPAAVMNAFCQDKRLNVSAAYLRPGFAFGGSCLPKDTRAAIATAQQHGLRMPLIESVLDSNQAHLSRLVDRIVEGGPRRTLLAGLSFKAGTDDLRGSPMVQLAQRLLDRNLPLLIHDPDLAAGRITQGGAEFLDKHLPRLRPLLCDDLSRALRWADVVVVTKPNARPEPDTVEGKTVIDLTGGGKSAKPQAAGTPTIRIAA